MSEDRLVAKTARYREMLAAALHEATPADGGARIETSDAVGDTTDGGGGAAGRELIAMARNYLEDGRHYEDEGDHVTALASYSYGHGWLDAGVRAGVIDADDPDLFVVDG